MKRQLIKPLLLLTLMVGSACSAAKFKAPQVDLPQSYLYERVTTPGDTTVNLEWWENFGDSTLTALVEEALAENFDVRIAAISLMTAKLQLKQARAGLAPVFGLAIDADATYTPSTKIVQDYSIQPTLSWEIDLFGKLRYEAVAKRAEMFSSAENVRAVKLSVASEVADAYFDILEYDLSRRIAESTLEIREQYAELVGVMVEYGEGTELEVQQNRELVATAKAALEKYTLSTQQAVMALSVLLGRNPTQMEVDGRKLLDYCVPKSVPGGLPSSLLERRADIKEAYWAVESAYAKVGVQIASRFPTISLTAEGGIVGASLSALFTDTEFNWTAGLSLVEPLFSFGRLRRNVEIAQQEKEQSLLTYSQKVITALSEVEKALLGIEYMALEIEAERELVEANKIYEELTEELYKGGVGDYLTVLDAQRQYFASQLSYASLLSSQLSGYVTLYKALGGGW